MGCAHSNDAVAVEHEKMCASLSEVKAVIPVKCSGVAYSNQELKSAQTSESSVSGLPVRDVSRSVWDSVGGEGGEEGGR